MKKYIFLQGTNNYLITKRSQELISQINKDLNCECEVVLIDFEQNDFNDFLDQLLTVSLFQSPKIILVSNISKIKDYTPQTKKILLTFFKENTINTYIIVKSVSENTNHISFFEIVKLFFEIEQIGIPSKDELLTYTQEKFKQAGKRITISVVNTLLDKTGYDPALLDSEIEKLILYKGEDKEVTDSDLETVLPLAFEQDIFKLTKSYLTQDIDNAVSMFKLLISSQTSPHSILMLFEKTILNLYLLKRLMLQNLADSTIAKKMMISDGKLYYLKKDVESFTSKSLEQTISEISELDYQVKAGLIEPELGMELFLLKRRKN